MGVSLRHCKGIWGGIWGGGGVTPPSTCLRLFHYITPPPPAPGACKTIRSPRCASVPLQTATCSTAPNAHRTPGALGTPHDHHHPHDDRPAQTKYYPNPPPPLRWLRILFGVCQNRTWQSCPTANGPFSLHRQTFCSDFRGFVLEDDQPHS